MKQIKKKDNQIKFTEKIDESLANAIRRYIGQIPVPAIDELEIIKNDSPLYDEAIAHRIGLIPLKMDKQIDEKKASLKLDEKKEGIIYSGDLKGNVEVVFDKIPITTLNKGEELIINANLRMGRGEEHSKFYPGFMVYRNIIDIKLDKDCPKEVIDICPQDIFGLEKDQVVVRNNEDCDMCEACVNFCRKNGKDSIKLIPTKDLLITLESFGQLESEEIFKRSIEILKEDLAEVSREISR